jgi:hypothetical protein
MLSKLRTALRAGARLHKTSSNTSLGLAVALGALAASWPGMAPGQDQTREMRLSPVVETREGPV